MTITDTVDGVVIDVRVTPRSSRSGFMGPHDGTLRLHLHASPVDGAANTEVIDVIAKLLHMPRRAVTIVTGHRNRMKRVRVVGVSASHVRTTLDADDNGGASPPPSPPKEK